MCELISPKIDNAEHKSKFEEHRVVQYISRAASKHGLDLNYRFSSTLPWRSHSLALSLMRLYTSWLDEYPVGQIKKAIEADRRCWVLIALIHTPTLVVRTLSMVTRAALRTDDTLWPFHDRQRFLRMQP